MPVGKREASLHVPRCQFERCRQQNTSNSNWRRRGAFFGLDCPPDRPWPRVETRSPTDRRSILVAWKGSETVEGQSERTSQPKNGRETVETPYSSSATAGAIRSWPHACRCQFPSSARARRALGRRPHSRLPSPPSCRAARALPLIPLGRFARFTQAIRHKPY